MKEPGVSGRRSLSEDEQAAVHFAEKLTAWPGSMSQADLDSLGKHFSVEQIAELVLTVATANLTNRFNEGMRTPVDV